MVTLTLASLSSSTSVSSLSETHLLSILAIWKRISSTTGNAYNARLSIYDSIQTTAPGFWQHSGFVKFQSKSFSSKLSPCFNKNRLRLNLIGVKGTNCRSWSYVLELNAASLFPRSPASVWISCCPPLAWVISHTTERASCWFQQLWKTFKKLKGAADNISISLNQTNSLKQYTQLCV